MALSFSDNIGYSGSRNNFERDYYATIADMVAVKKTKMPTMFIAMCGETGKAYLYNKSNEFDETLGLWRELGGGSSGGGSSGGGSSGGGGSNPSEPSEPSTTYTLYYGYINGSLPTTEKVTDEGFTINADVLKALSSKTITSKSNSITYTATETEDSAPGQSFPTYAYPASLGEITKYTNSVGTFNVVDSYTRFDIDVDGTAYYAYVQTKGHAPMAGDTFDFTYA